jgi:L-alanine-DL-glutamate epimerase-like enolase superfamily enzyme
MKITGAAAAGSMAFPGQAGLWCRLELTCDEGLAGESLCPVRVRDQALTLANDRLVDWDPRAASALWDRLAGNAGDDSAAAARASLDLACWDLAAKLRGEPLWKTLGGSRPHAMVHVAMPGVPESDDAVRRWFGNVAEVTAFRAGCLALSGMPATDARRLALIRDTLEKQVKPVDLAVDAGRSWPDERIRRIREIERSVDLSWVKVAAGPGDELACRRLVDSVRAAVCVGGELTAERDFMTWLHQRAANLIELDIHRLGFTGTLRAADAAFGFELPVVLAPAPGHVQVHLAPVLPSFMSAGIVDPAAENTGVFGDLRFVSGRGVMGDRPGAGLVFDRNSPAAAKERSA